VDVNERAGLRQDMQPSLIEREAQVGLPFRWPELTHNLQARDRLSLAQLGDLVSHRGYQHQQRVQMTRRRESRDVVLIDFRARHADILYRRPGVG
jgi:hypothetical protein